jgi:hypothetical protein
LINEQELVVEHTVERLERHMIFASPGMLRSIANDILQKAHYDPGSRARQVSERGCWRYLNLHPELKTEVTRLLSDDRRAAHDREMTLIWFRGYQDTINEYHISGVDM